MLDKMKVLGVLKIALFQLGGIVKKKLMEMYALKNVEMVLLSALRYAILVKVLDVIKTVKSQIQVIFAKEVDKTLLQPVTL